MRVGFAKIGASAENIDVLKGIRDTYDVISKEEQIVRRIEREKQEKEKEIQEQIEYKIWS